MAYIGDVIERIGDVHSRLQELDRKLKALREIHNEFGKEYRRFSYTSDFMGLPDSMTYEKIEEVEKVLMPLLLKKMREDFEFISENGIKLEVYFDDLEWAEKIWK